jgi:hypothetical protein
MESILAATRHIYGVGVARYIDFCKTRNITAFPVSEQALVEFAASATADVQHQTIKVYLAGT